MNNTIKIDGQLKMTLVATSLLGALMMLISFMYYKSTPILLGVFFGCVLGIANFVFLIKIVVKLLDQNYKRKLIIALFFLFKLVFIAIILGVSFWYFSVHKVAFVMGYLCLIISITVVQVISGGSGIKKQDNV